MVYTLGEASKATGRSKSTISKAIKSGRISATKGETGAFAIDPSELHRVYPAIVESEQNRTLQTPKVNSRDDGLIRELQARLEATQERLTDKESVITDLREDRDRWRQQATTLLEDKRPRGFWKKLFGN
ncbi:hypothetical protein [Primorskyibacter flagellatus]|uniref:hypothetical protein n=1 Tax=Primorskyibacter flagellatus TaxID=1387277 RepID=UPI000A016368|nr:hypothetical protein [Primorskyibacter flagellatus]